MAERYNAAVEFVDRNLAEGRAEKVAFRDPRRSLTYGELHDQASRVGPALAALGIAPEHRVVMLMLDTVDFPVVFWGAIRAGIIPVPLNTLLAPDQYAYVLEDSRAPLVVVSAPLLPAVEAAIAASGRRVKVVVAGAEPGTRAPAARRSPDGGCTGRRAGRDLRRRGRVLALLLGLDRHAEGRQARAFEPDGDGRGSTARACSASREDDVVYSAAKLFFAYGLGNAMTFPMSVGATAVLLRRAADAGSRCSRCSSASSRRSSSACRRSTPRCWPIPTCTPENGSRAPAPLRLGRRGAARACRASPGRSASASTSSTASARPRCCTSSSRNRPGRPALRHLGQRRCPATSCASSTRTAARSATARSASCWCAGPSPPRATGTSARRRARTFEGDWTRTGDKYVARCRRATIIYCGRTDDMFKVQRHLGLAVRGRDRADQPRRGARGRRGAEPRMRDGLLKPKAFIVLKSAGAAADGLGEELKEHVKSARSARGNTRAGSSSSTACRRPRRARSSASS